MNGACRCPFPRSHLRPIRRRREKRDRTVMGRERTTSGTGVTTSMSLTFRSLTVHTVPVPFASRVAAAEPANGTGYERWAWEAKGLWDERSGRWIHSKFCQSSGLFTHIILLLPTSSPPPVACRSLRHEKRRWCEGEEWGEVDSVPVIILVLLSIILSSYNPYPSETGPKGRAPVSPAHLTSFGAGKRAPPGMVSGVNRVPVVFSLSFTPLLITHSRLSLVYFLGSVVLSSHSPPVTPFRAHFVHSPLRAVGEWNETEDVSGERTEHERERSEPRTERSRYGRGKELMNGGFYYGFYGFLLLFS